MKLQKMIAVMVLLLVFTCCSNDDILENSEPVFELISNSGGRVAWYASILSEHELIAFDSIVDDVTKHTEVFTMQPNGTGVFNVTGPNTDVHNDPNAGFIGQPEWHPDGEHIIFQVENSDSQGMRFNHVSFGINNDLWIIKKDGTGAERIWETPPNNAALHPHFNADGTKLIFSQRIATGEILYPLTWTPGGENPWAGWQIHIADFDITQTGTAKLSNNIVLFGEGDAKDRGFYETHGFKDADTIVYSHTEGGAPYVDDIFTAGTDGSNVINLIQSPTTWEEHGIYSPSRNSIAFLSSRVNPDWTAPADNASTLRLELYLQTGSEITQVTSFNENGDVDKRYLASDFEWDRTGSRIIIQVASVDDISGTPYSPEIWMITFPTIQ